MINVNVIYEDVYDDADIIAIPREVFVNLDTIVEEFMKWKAPEDDKDYWTILNGKKYSVLETVGFVKWLNNYHCNNTKKAYIIAQNTNYCPEYKNIEF